jgi:hypothetical protein
MIIGIAAETGEGIRTLSSVIVERDTMEKRGE